MSRRGKTYSNARTVAGRAGIFQVTWKTVEQSIRLFTLTAMWNVRRNYSLLKLICCRKRSDNGIRTVLGMACKSQK